MAREDYADYAAWLHQREYWPKRVNSDRTTTVPVDSMAPQYAASALAKLLRWAYDEGYPRLNIYDADERITMVRRSELGMALMLRAVGLYDQERLSDIYGPTYPPLVERPAALDPKRAVMVVLTQIVKHEPDMGVGQMADLAEDIVAGWQEDGYTLLSSTSDTR